MKPIGKSYGGFYIYPIASKRYRCSKCGYISIQSTNHFQPTWSWGHVNVCPQCPPYAKYPEFGGSTVWICLDKPDDEETVAHEQSFAESIQQEADELLSRPQENDTLVIHMADPSTDFLKGIYEGKGYPVIRGRISEAELMVEIERYPRLFMLGHGGPAGLFGPGYLIGHDFGEELSKKTGIFIWCHAVEFAHRHKLTGLVSGMFISEVREAEYMGIAATEEEVNASNYAFSKAVRRFIDTGSSPHEVMKCYNDAACQVVKYNNERLYVMEKGVILDTLGKPQPEDVSAKPGSPRYRDPKHPSEPLRGTYGELDEPPEEFKGQYGWDEPITPENFKDWRRGLADDDDFPESISKAVSQEADRLLEAIKCECADPACPVCGGQCPNRATVNLRRVDMDDQSGTMFCPGCSEDAMNSGLFTPSVAAYIAGTRRGQPRPKAAHGMPPPPAGPPRADIIDPTAPTGGSLAAESRIMRKRKRLRAIPPKAAEMQTSWT